MIVHKIHDSSNSRVIRLLEESFKHISDENLIKNYHPDFKSEPANIFYILNDNNGRYQTGCYYVLEEDNFFVGSAGWNEYELDRTIALALTRTYMNPKYRGNYFMGTYILPDIIKSTESYDKLYITADSHNSVIYKFFEKIQNNTNPDLFNQWKKFKPIGKQNIYYTEQYVIAYQK